MDSTVSDTIEQLKAWAEQEANTSDTNWAMSDSLSELVTKYNNSKDMLSEAQDVLASGADLSAESLTDLWNNYSDLIPEILAYIDNPLSKVY
jgi:ABC-type transporter Mla subunit MlaD